MLPRENTTDDCAATATSVPCARHARHGVVAVLGIARQCAAAARARIRGRGSQPWLHYCGVPHRGDLAGAAARRHSGVRGAAAPRVPRHPLHRATSERAKVPPFAPDQRVVERRAERHRVRRRLHPEPRRCACEQAVSGMGK
jgi:hypothetical protein